MADVSFSGDATVVDGTAVAASTGSASLVGGVYNDAIATLGSGNGGLARLTQYRALHVNLRDASGNAVSVGGGTQYVEDVGLGAVGAATGTLTMGRASAAAPTSVSADADAAAVWVSRFGALNVILRDTSGAYVSPGSPAKPGTGTQSSVASSASDTTILASNSNRLGAAIYNDSTQVLYLLLASGTASATAFTVKVASGGYYELPPNMAGYTGVIKGLWASANGNARVTEWTA
ncbi:MAG: hypothetical protein ACOYB2_10525 [Limnohabitans sp.]